MPTSSGWEQGLVAMIAPCQPKGERLCAGWVGPRPPKSTVQAGATTPTPRSWAARAKRSS